MAHRPRSQVLSPDLFSFRGERRSKRGSGLWRFLAIWLAFISLAAPACASIELKLSPAKPISGVVKFHEDTCEAVASFPSGEEGLEQQATDHFIVGIDKEKIHSRESGLTIYEFYVRPKLGGPAQSSCHFLVKAGAVGAFLDQMIEVPFEVSEGSVIDEGVVLLPIFNQSSMSPLEATTKDVVTKVRIKGQTDVWITLSNSLSDLPIIVDAQIGVSPTTTKDLWRSYPAQLQLGNATTLTLPKKGKLNGAIHLVLEPYSWKAFTAAFLPLTKEKTHDQFIVTAEYSVPGGFHGTLPIPIAVRFFPSPWTLILTVIAGAFLGSLVPVIFYSGKRKMEVWLKAFAAAAVVGLLVWLIGLVLVSNNSELRVVGIELDPFQIVPSVLIGGLVGLYGFRSAEAVQGFIKNRFGGDRGAAPLLGEAKP